MRAFLFYTQKFPIHAGISANAPIGKPYSAHVTLRFTGFILKPVLSLRV